MRISRKTDYAIRTLFSLVDEYGNGPVPIRVLAERNSVPKPFLEHIVLEMKAQGWVDSVAGKKGGYFLSRDPEKITMGEVIRYFEAERLALESQQPTNFESITHEGARRFSRMLHEIRIMTDKLMDESSLADVCHGTSTIRESYFDTVTGGLGI
ncbi:MAG TPA: Rrf2 family transcriptional regulator [Candidatus Sumerlaeota bacterium]|nr:Rrf2 family transcriptional regulator [Candidatus Sumerlaeota bacterium]HMZ51502.1 Rrf2 family transcriptional regulator [Candidatus Sumerlaeota bacterium]